MKRFLMGNEAIGLAALNAGAGLITGYPGTPSTEVLESAVKFNTDGSARVEWAVNEKTALEVAAGASYAGMRTVVTMKQVGLNVASDPLMSLAYIGVKGGMIILVADDPGPISSQTEQDTRSFAEYSKLPVFDPSSVEEAYSMVADAFELSEKYSTPVILRPTTRVCHACADIEVSEGKGVKKPGGFIKDSKWVIFPRLSYSAHLNIEKRNPLLGDELCSYKYNSLQAVSRKGIAAGGVSVAYAKEALGLLDADCTFLKIATPHPFPEALALEFLKSVDEVLCCEELDPVIERKLIYLCGKHGLNVKIHGKIDGAMPFAGENTVEKIKNAAAKLLNIKLEKQPQPELPPLPVRPPVLCAGCPHRASFYAVKKAVGKAKAVFSGDIGCYTLGNAAPLNAVDTCLCMGAGITVAQGLHIAESDTLNFSFVGDSTFFHTGIPGIINAVYNKHDIIVIVLDNSTTAMTGHQPHPGLGRTASGEVAEKISIEALLLASGVKFVKTVNPLELDNAISTVKEAIGAEGVRAIIFKSPCIALFKPESALNVDSTKCTGCLRCVKELGCPAIMRDGDKVKIEASLCNGCGLCKSVCPFSAISEQGEVLK